MIIVLILLLFEKIQCFSNMKQYISFALLFFVFRMKIIENNNTYECDGKNQWQK